MTTTNGHTIGFLATTMRSARDVEREHLMTTALSMPFALATYYVGERLAALFPDSAVLETRDGDFDLTGFVKAGRCIVVHRTTPRSQILAEWDVEDACIVDEAVNSWADVVWEGAALEVLILSWGDHSCQFVLANERALARRFFAAVCTATQTVDAEVLVFGQGHWSKDEHLYRSIQGARLDALVLGGTLKEDVRADAERFFRARATYERYNIPWKRGLLFVGPPGNGKTHMVKGLLNTLGQPALYVKAFRSKDGPDEYAIQRVFAKARAAAPCVLVLEDLDSIVTDENRSFFLNEMDGFAVNSGVLTIATTNHPEKLDAAITRRPSRFDRTYRFELPALAERLLYIAHWSSGLDVCMRLTDAGANAVAEATDDFSYAYLKELFLSSMMRWLELERGTTMDIAAVEQVALLRDQMRTALQEDETENPT